MLLRLLALVLIFQSSLALAGPRDALLKKFKAKGFYYSSDELFLDGVKKGDIVILAMRSCKINRAMVSDDRVEVNCKFSKDGDFSVIFEGFRQDNQFKSAKKVARGFMETPAIACMYVDHTNETDNCVLNQEFADYVTKS